MYRRKQIQISADFLTQNLKARRSWNNIYQALKENGCQQRMLCLAKLNFRFENEIKTFHDKQRSKQSTTTKPVLQNILNKIFYEDKIFKKVKTSKGRTTLKD